MLLSVLIEARVIEMTRKITSIGGTRTTWTKERNHATLLKKSTLSPILMKKGK